VKSEQEQIVKRPAIILMAIGGRMLIVEKFLTIILYIE
jgi:hypothetical protein